MRIDAHHHVWDLDVREQPWTADLPPLRRSFGFGELRPALERNRFDGSIVVQTVCVADETPELLALAAAESRIVGVVGWVDLTDPGIVDRVGELREGRGGERLVGVRHQVQDEPAGWLLRDDVRRGLAALAELGLVYELIVRPEQLAEVERTVAALPEVVFVLDHGGKPAIAAGEPSEWATRVRALARHPQLSVKLSGLATEAGPDWSVATLRPFAEVLLDAFGPRRTMFGSDWPVCLLAGSYDEIVEAAEELTAAVSADERAEVFGGTAERLYGVVR